MRRWLPPLCFSAAALCVLTVATATFSAGPVAQWINISLFGRTLVDDADASTARTTLGLGTIATQAANNVTITGGSVSGITDLAVVDGGTGASDASGARTNLGLGTIATQAANNITITGGSISGITDLAVADGGTGASDASGARTNLGVAIGSDVQGYDAELAAWAGLTSAADKLGYFTGSGSAATTDFTSTARSLVDDTSTTAMRTTLGLGTMATAAASDYAALAGSNIFTADQTIRSSDSGGGSGPFITLDRASSSPVANDVIGAIAFTGRNSSAATASYAQIYTAILDTTAGAVSGQLRLLAFGPSNTNMQIDASGISMSPTGGTGHVLKQSSSGGYLSSGKLTSSNIDSSDAANIRSTIGAAGVDQGVFRGRLTLTSGTAVTTSDVTAATTLYLTPYGGATIALYDGSSSWAYYTLSEISISLSGKTADTNYDVFVYDSSGLTLELVAWTNATTRATALALQNGVYVKSGSTTKRYCGTIRTTSSTGQTEDSLARRFVVNYYNQKRRPLYQHDATDSWSYTTSSWRSWNNSTSNRVEILSPLGESHVWVNFIARANGQGLAGLGLDSTTQTTLDAIAGTYSVSVDNNDDCLLTRTVSIGYHYIQMLERGNASVTFYGDNGSSSTDQTFKSALNGWIDG